MAGKQPAPAPERRIEIEILSGPDTGCHFGVLLSQWRKHYPDVEYRIVGTEPTPAGVADETNEHLTSHPEG